MWWSKNRSRGRGNTILEAILYFDGGIREGTMAYGWLLVDSEDKTKIIAFGNKTCGIGTSNISEYRALIAGLEGSLKAGIDVIHIIGDSQLIVRQVTKVFKVNKPELKRHRDCVLELLEQFEDYTIKWVPRRENKRADALVNAVFERKNKKCSKKQRKKRS